jgi:ATP-binding cassette subfamily B protein
VQHVVEASSSRLRVIRQLPHAGLKLVAVLVVVDLALGLLPIGFILATSVLIGRVPAAVSAGIESPQWDDLVSTFLMASALFLVQQLLTPLQVTLGERMKHRVDGHFHRRLIAVSLRSTGIGPLENQAVLDKMREASEMLESGFRTPGDATAGILAYLTRYSRLAGFCVLLGIVVSPWAAVAVLISTMCFRYGQRGPGLTVFMQLWPVLGPIRRERDYFREIGWQASTAKEMRIYGLVDWAVGRYRSKADESLTPLWVERRRYMMYRFLWYTVFGLVIDCAVAALMVRSAALDELTLTQLVLGMQALVAAVLLGEHYHEADVSTQYGMQAARALEEFDELAQAHNDRDVRDTPAGDDAGDMPRESIRFEDVSFRYEGSHRAVYENFNLTLRAGECTALVGLNGAGKTTLVKLLARLYEPNGGSLLIDGRDARNFSVDSWRRQIGVIFQDFNRYELSATDNIAFGAIERPVQAENVAAAAATSGMTAAIAALPRGYDTVLTRKYDDGADLSGGQWQRIAIARALYAVDAGAKVLVLDEPTAALDPRSEAAFFEEFASLTRGLTTLLISHRFSSVRQADRIVVLEHGQVIEDGTHEALLEQDGRYAEMFHLQAERFADDEPESEDVER